MSHWGLNFEVNVDLISADSVFCIEFVPYSGFLQVEFFTTRNRNYTSRKDEWIKVTFLCEYSIIDTILNGVLCLCY